MSRSLSSDVASWRPSAQLDAVESYDRFEILGRIGRGGMAEILLARERSLSGATRHLVIKRVLPEIRDFSEMLHMFLDETRVVMGLSHPNLCQIYEVGEHQGAWYIAMEWVNGVTLHQLLRRALEHGQVDYGVLARIVGQCADALHYAHTARDAEGQLMHLVHRDVSPHNLMVAYDGRVKLLDFGIAKSNATTHHTEAGVVKGKVCYMAPEQWLAQPLDGRSDVFSLGACLHEALTGRVLFKRDHQADVMKAAIAGDVPCLREVAPHVPEALAAIAHRALSPELADRFQSAREMSEALDRFVATLAEPVNTARIAAYTRRLFRSEVQLGPMLERSQRGAQLARSASLLLPPLPASLRGVTKSVSEVPLPAPFQFGRSMAPTAAPAPRSSDEVGGEGRGWSRVDALDTELCTQPARLDARGDTSAMRAGLSERARPPESFTEEPTRRPSLPAPEEPEPVQVPRPLARTLSMRVGAQARYVALASVVALAAVPTYLASSAALRGERKPPALQSYEAPSLRGASPPAAQFTIMPPSAQPTAHSQREHKRSVSASSGLLSINTNPWSTVYLGSRLLGSTPLANVPVARGTLMLRLVDRDGHVHLRRIAPSQQKHRSAYFQF
jgi:eukaryotic-like serine/threonine-protein kinase